MFSIARLAALTSAVTGLVLGTAAMASATETAQPAEPLSVPVLTVTPLVTTADDALSLRDAKDLASMAHLGSLENSNDLASMAHFGSLENSKDLAAMANLGSLEGVDLSKTTSLEGSNWSRAGSLDNTMNQVNTTIPVMVPVNVPVVTNLPVALVNRH